MFFPECLTISDKHSIRTRSTFVRPDWGIDCDPAEFCEGEDVPTPPVDNKLVRLDNKTRFRVDEAAYFGCTEPEAVLKNEADVNIFELKCLTGGVWDTNFDECYVEPVCDNIPDPEVRESGNGGTGCSHPFPRDCVRPGRGVTYEL